MNYYPNFQWKLEIILWHIQSIETLRKMGSRNPAWVACALTHFIVSVRTKNDSEVTRQTVSPQISEKITVLPHVYQCLLLFDRWGSDPWRWESTEKTPELQTDSVQCQHCHLLPELEPTTDWPHLFILWWNITHLRTALQSLHFRIEYQSNLWSRILIRNGYHTFLKLSTQPNVPN